MSKVSTCPICKTDCDITEEDLIDADCGACGPVTIHVHCKEKYCRQQGIPKGQYKGYTCPQCTRAKVSAQHHRQREKKSKATVAAKKEKAAAAASAAAAAENEGGEARRREPILNVQDLITSVLADLESDPTALAPLKNAFKKLLQMHRAFKEKEQDVVNIWKPFAHFKVRQEYQVLRSQEHEAYVQASSLLKLTSSSVAVEMDTDEICKKREEVAAKLLKGTPEDVIAELDGSLEYGRCAAMYEHVVGNVDMLLQKCETATLYLDRLRKSLPVEQLVQLDEHTQAAVWPSCDIEQEAAEGFCCFHISNASMTSDDHQLRSPPFYAVGVPWTLRLYKAKSVSGQDNSFLAAYLDAGNALRLNQDFEQEVTFTFALRKSPDQTQPVICRKEATFTFNKSADNRGWKECIPAAQVEDGPLYFSVEVREGSTTTEITSDNNITITVKLEGHPNCPTASFKVKPSTPMQRLMESYCSKNFFRAEKVKLKYLDKKSGAAKPVEADQTPSDLGMSLEHEELVAVIKDDEVAAVMKRAGVELLEAAEAMDKCLFQPRKALQLLESQKKAREMAEKTEKKAKELAEAEAEAAQERAKSRGSDAKSKEDEAAKLAEISRQSQGAFPTREALATGKEEDAPVEQKKGKKNKKGEPLGFEDVDAPKAPAVQGRKSEEGGDFGGRKVFIGGTADKDEAELTAHFAQAFGPVAEVEVVRERDGSYRGFAFVTFQDKKHADMLKRQHHTNIGNVRMEAKPCVPPRFAVPSHIRYFPAGWLALCAHETSFKIAAFLPERFFVFCARTFFPRVSVRLRICAPASSSKTPGMNGKARCFPGLSSPSGGVCMRQIMSVGPFAVRLYPFV